jgi:hypothetical protein
VTLKQGPLALSAEGAGWRQIAGTLTSDILQAWVWHNTSVCDSLINLRAARACRREQAS